MDGEYVSIQELKDKEKEERCNYIINASEKLFFSKGFDNVSMKDISKEVGMSRAALYLYFENKKMIYFAIVLRAAKIMNKMFKKSLKSEKKAIDKLKDLGNAYFDFYKNFTDYYNAYLYFKSERFTKDDNEYVSKIMQLSKESFQITCELAKEGIEDGSMRKDLNPVEIAIYGILTSRQLVEIDSWAINALESNDISYDQFIDHTMDLWKRMIMNNENNDLK